MEHLTLTALREQLFEVVDQIIKTGVPVEIERHGHRLRIVLDDPPKKLAKLRPRNTIVGDAEDLVDLETDGRSEDRLGPQRRLVIPAHLRRALDLKPGDRLIARQHGDSIVLERCENLVGRLRARFARVPADASLVDELIAERQTEATRDSKE